MSKYFEENTLNAHLTKMLIATALNNTEYKTYASNVYRDIAVNRLSVWLEYAPKADVVEVVRCKDCQYWDNYDDANRCKHESGGMWAKPNAFCSYGERREDGEE